MAEIAAISPQTHAARDYSKIAARDKASWTGGGTTADGGRVEEGKAAVAETYRSIGGANVSGTNEFVTSGVRGYRYAENL